MLEKNKIARADYILDVGFPTVFIENPGGIIHVDFQSILLKASIFCINHSCKQ